ncbi:hypothetical protein BASA50_001063 [Batrachochytrium salamandrivorans]|uniref:Prefoldin subunit 2 n=1 Tax=Batrachochytrium salamandrivorans TaxID=1357716 RepID=A0ABQ8EV89_9FUNG|nr:hypothetical protein BASA62_002869 [Batrachochytrium salamandrivorans]KAH6576506.1 hypothetical protein BASA60_004500 [Batrachochytrium salamandrivorans]KAH6576523.1 hypothetical protein BASA60_004518 [Batrachochytrium salamandrivorans]KAH6585728.1 hypothetical protein BASA50_001063 [Batrachochytrium salamandrivorans]KAH6588208.1 hypothetical protein BASA61_006017 [Batrachochytrium salamandrivorans]
MSTVSSSSAAPAAKVSDQEINAKLNSMKQELRAISEKIGELELEREEHQLVIDTMAPLVGDRKCFRLVGGVLVERTVKDVLPVVQSNMDSINALIKQLATNYKKLEGDAESFKQKNTPKVKA